MAAYYSLLTRTEGHSCCGISSPHRFGGSGGILGKETSNSGSERTRTRRLPRCLRVPTVCVHGRRYSNRSGIFHPTTVYGLKRNHQHPCYGGGRERSTCYGRGEQITGALAKAVGDQRQRGEAKEQEERRITGEEAWTALRDLCRSQCSCVCCEF